MRMTSAKGESDVGRAIGTTLTAVALFSAALLLFGGCSNTGTGPEEVEATYAVRTTPTKVLTKLNQAYVAMDAEAYLDCLAEDFEFILNPDDVGNPENPLPESWGKQGERQIHEAMFGDSTNVDRVRLTLTTISSGFDPGADPYDESDDRYTLLEGTDLRVTIGYWTFLANADQEFVFQVDPDETGPARETLWEIIAWIDIREERGESATWGSIKALYR